MKDHKKYTYLDNKQGSSIELYTHKILSLAYVPYDDFTSIFNLLKDDVPDDLLSLARNQIILIQFMCLASRLEVEGGEAFLPDIHRRYEITLMLLRLDFIKPITLMKDGTTGFRLSYVGKIHYDSYSALTKFQKEQADLKLA